MKEKPIIFSTPMVRAIMDGRKTMTRRVVPEKDRLGELSPLFCKYKEGDLLWVRETWRDGCKWDEKPYEYRADFDDTTRKWKPSIHMPRKAARIFLEVTDVFAERLQYITEEDAKADGVTVDGHTEPSYRENFRQLWDSLNAKRGYGWETNPWVYVISFRRVSHEICK